MYQVDHDWASVLVSAVVILCGVLQVGNVGGLLGPWLIGRVLEATGGYAAALQALGLMVAAAGCLTWSFRRWKL
jgi:nitrate/nitrite transporter NarK